MHFAVSILAFVLVLAGVDRLEAQSPVERGKYLVEVIGACGNCHTPKGPAGELPGKHMAGGFVIKEPFGEAITPNITPDRETGIGGWSDAEIIRAIREGKGRDGRTLGPPMPYWLYRDLSDTDVKAIVAYLRTVPAIRNRPERSRYVIKLPESWGPPVGSVPDPSRNDPVKYGAYLAGPVAHCSECHTPQRPDGHMDSGRLFAGGYRFTGPFGASYSSNLTPDRETGIGAWTDAQIVAAIYGVKPSGQPVLPPMPWPYYAGRLAEADLKAIVAYLRSLPAIRNVVPPAEPPAKR
jgi:mono/diheme cytochrome c family protein